MASRLVVAFAGVAVLAVGVLGVLIWATTESEVSSLVETRRTETAADVAAALADAYTAGGSWSGADLRAARMLATSSGATLVVRDSAGATVRGGPGFGMGMGMGSGMMGMGAAEDGPLGAPLEVDVVAGGTQVGTAELRFPVATPEAEQQVRSALGRTVLWGGLLAAALAVAAGLLVARRIVRPLRSLTTAARSLAAGDRSARADGGSEPAELGELGRAFDRMAETIEREDLLRRAFAADVAHELRTPLTIAQGELEALVDGVEEPTPERLRSLHEETLRLARIVADVETLAAAEGARLRLERRRIDLAEVAREAVSHLHAQADASGLRLTTQLESVTVDADPARLEQIARNLLGNALKFTPSGGSVAVSVAAANGDARLVVEDSGPGIPEDELPHVFERFWRGRHGRAATGSGIGLAVVAELTRAHGGRIEATSRPGGGARFTVTLPRA
jgi:two-component system sensor histidine kinase BaeS